MWGLISVRHRVTQALGPMEDHQDTTFWQFLGKVAKAPLASFHGSPLTQSAAAVGINLWCLLLAVLGQFWVFLSALLLLAQFYNTWLVAQHRISRFAALALGLLILAINLGALVLAVLGQFWVAASIILSIWQYWSLIRVCWARRKGGPNSSSKRTREKPRAA